MSLILLAPPAEEPVSLAEAKAHCRVIGDDEDALLAGYIGAARRAVEARAGIAIIAQSWRLVLDHAPNAILALPRRPVASVDAVETLDRDGAASPVPAEAYDLDGRGRIAARRPWPRPGRLIGGVRIDFTAGWPDADSAPGELKLAVKMLAAHFFENREGVAGERVFTTPLAVDALIAPFRGVRL